MLMRSRLILVIACLVFLALGLLTSALGPVLPELAHNNHTDLAGIGAVFTALFLGALAAQVCSGPLSDRYGQRPVLMIGSVLLMTGMAGITLSPVFSLTLILAFLGGLGHGAVDLSTTVMIARAFNGRSVSALNLLNVFFGLGAFVGPVLVSLSWRLWSQGVVVLWIGSALVLLLFPLVWQLRVMGGSTQMQQASEQQLSVYRSVRLWGMGALILLYVGVESGLGGWATAYLEKTTAVSVDLAALVAAGFWLALTLGRMAGAVLGARWAPWHVLQASLAGAVAGGILLIIGTGTTWLTVLGVAVVGFSFGPVYPTMMSITTAAFSASPGKAASVTAAMGSLGGMILPWCQGVLMERVSPLASILFAVAGILGMAGLLVALHSRERAAPVPDAALCAVWEVGKE